MTLHKIKNKKQFQFEQIKAKTNKQQTLWPGVLDLWPTVTVGDLPAYTISVYLNLILTH